MEINIYAYLLRIEDCRTYQCIPTNLASNFLPPTPPMAALTQASYFDVKILLAGVNPSPPCRPRAGTSRQHCRKVSVKIGFGNMAEPNHSGLP